MGKASTEKAVLKALDKTPKSRRDLKKITEKKGIRSALKALCERGEVLKDGKLFLRVTTSKEQEQKESVKLQTAALPQAAVLPIAERLRKETILKKSVRIVEPEVDLDDEIARLEAELQASSSSDDESENEDIDGAETSGVLSLSKFSENRISSLPASALPQPGRYKTNGERRSEKKPKQVEVPDGLREAVKEVLNGYKARSSEKLPFYCRVCQVQLTNEDEFFQHKRTQFHKTAVAMEQKATYCKLCRKQLTSPAQMKEHLKSKPHRSRLQFVKEKQQGQRTRAASKKQWS
ncbi:unnamed protein product [Cylindrotheca closterium]|uniref:C2H2-type domain-containing protein n=1 Tax=Cylindrotheca closterium TaxID=2856 RepID=A0AAD2FC40_9STRA|nr:unnamed protein product [Cylindrotheca closterium]